MDDAELIARNPKIYKKREDNKVRKDMMNDPEMKLAGFYSLIIGKL